MKRGLIVGFGEIARHGHWPAYAVSNDVEIVAVVDTNQLRRAFAAQVIRGVRTFATLADVDVEIDFADVCTPPSMHQEPMLNALARGWHVLCEKPFVLRSELVTPIVARAAASNLAVVPVHNWKYAPILRRATDLLTGGTVGTLRHLRITTTRMQAASTADGGAYNWRHDPAVAGGGILMDHGWHAIYLAMHWFGEVPLATSADLRRAPGAGVESDVDLRLRFPSGDAHIVLTWNGHTRRNVVVFVGDRGEMVADDDTLSVPGEDRVERFAPLSAGSHHADWFTAMLPDVIACFRDPARSRSLLDEARQCVGIIEQAYAGSAIVTS